MSSQPLVSGADVAGARVDNPRAPHAADHQHDWKWWARRIVGATLLGAAVALAYGRREELRQAIDLLGHLRLSGLAVAIALEAASLVAFARLQRWLLHEGGVEVGLVPMVQITLAGNALAMSLPGGAAWAAAWAFGQLRRRGADRVLAGWVVLVAGAIASYALFMILVAGSLVAGSAGPVASVRPLLIALASIPFIVVALVIAARRFPIIDRLVPAGRRALEGLPKGHEMAAAVERAWERLLTVRPSGPAWFEAFGLAALNWIENCGCLVACIWAVHGRIPWHGILVAYALAQVLATVPITPGGLGVVEGSLTALLVAYGLPTNVALASVLLYRAVSFWGLVPVGWGVWGYLSWQSRKPARTQKRPHPWAVHLHRPRGAVDAPPRSAPDVLMPAEPCKGCPEHPDHPHDHVERRDEVKVS
ncbi:MAG TPA: lysylphosphatidylglycerol synthase transmembrane domain-containing protein [Acidimicrobiales bacterium]|nr:lysylphosphatidylglycerol synthase transmembrane domain-containing protein [Acidimicrobiales bacterium]